MALLSGVQPNHPTQKQSISINLYENNNTPSAMVCNQLLSRGSTINKTVLFFYRRFHLKIQSRILPDNPTRRLKWNWSAVRSPVRVY